MRRVLPALLLAFALPAAPAWADGGAEVPIYNAAYGATHVDVLAGETVKWHNDSVRAHTVKAIDGSWTSPRLTAMGMWERQFDAPGTVAYYCELHPTMRGDIGVHRVLLSAPTRRGGARASATSSPAVRRCRPAARCTIEADGGDAVTADRRRARRVHRRRSTRRRRRPTPRSPAASPGRPCRCSCSTAR